MHWRLFLNSPVWVAWIQFLFFFLLCCSFFCSLSLIIRIFSLCMQFAVSRHRGIFFINLNIYNVFQSTQWWRTDVIFCNNENSSKKMWLIWLACIFTPNVNWYIILSFHIFSRINYFGQFLLQMEWNEMIFIRYRLSFVNVSSKSINSCIWKLQITIWSRLFDEYLS